MDTEHWKEGSRPSQFIGSSIIAKKLRDEIIGLATTPLTIVLEGPTGTGKEILARMLHGYSQRAVKPFVVVNCGSIPETLMESELFGNERGAFTDAKEARPGKFEQADGGTIFLDEIGEFPLHLQVKILRILEDREIWRLGARKLRKIDVRIVAATNRNLALEVSERRFREDLYWRFDYIVPVPSLAERNSDIPEMAYYLLSDIAREFGVKKLPIVTEEAMARMCQHAWSGNVRELRRVLRWAVFNSRWKENIGVEDLPVDFGRLQAQSLVLPEQIRTIKELEREAIEGALVCTNGDKEKAAYLLGIGRRTIYKKLEKYKGR